MVFISGYDHELYDSMLTKGRGWVRKTIATSTKDTCGVSHDRTEIVWMNKYFVQSQKKEKISIKLSKKEKLQGKVNPSRKTKNRAGKSSKKKIPLSKSATRAKKAKQSSKRK